MSVHLTKSFAERVKETIDRMVEGNLNVLLVEGGKGMVVVREGTKEALERKKTDSKLFSYEIGDSTFTVCHS